MNNTRFNKLWKLLHERGEVEFSSRGGLCSLHIIPGRYGNEISLRSNGNTVLVHHNKDRFREILVD